MHVLIKKDTKNITQKGNDIFNICCYPQYYISLMIYFICVIFFFISMFCDLKSVGNKLNTFVPTNNSAILFYEMSTVVPGIADRHFCPLIDTKNLLITGQNVW